MKSAVPTLPSSAINNFRTIPSVGTVYAVKLAAAGTPVVAAAASAAGPQRVLQTLPLAALAI